MTFGRRVAKYCKAIEASVQPTLEKIACIAIPFMLSTNRSISSSVNFLDSGTGVSHVNFLYRSLKFFEFY